MPTILDGGDNLICLLLFWGMFLPLGRVWSLDGRLRRKRGSPAPDLAPVVSMATVGVLLQMSLMYVFSALSKSNADWWSGYAVAGSLAHDMYARPFGEWLLGFPKMLSLATFGVLAVEWLAPVVLFVTRRLSWRLLALASLAAVHLGIALGMQVGLFSYISLVGLTLFLPRRFWELSFFKSVRPAAGSGAMAYTVLVNINGVPAQPLRGLKLDRWPLWTAMGFSQRWGMFEKVPSKDGWYVASGSLEDGSEIDVFRDGLVLGTAKGAFGCLSKSSLAEVLS